MLVTVPVLPEADVSSQLIEEQRQLSRRISCLMLLSINGQLVADRITGSKV